MRIQAKQFPNFDDLTELEYIYYSVGFSYIQKLEKESKSELLTTIFKEAGNIHTAAAYECADIKSLLYDLNCCVRGLAGVKKSFEINDLPSVKHSKEESIKAQTQIPTDETDEERLERHKQFFANLKKTFDSK